MFRSILKAYLFDQVARAFVCVVAIPGNKCGREHILNHRTLREETVILKDKANMPVSEGRKLARRELEWIFTSQRDNPTARGFERAQNVKQCALTAAGGTHDRGGFAARKRERNVGENP